jgi:tetratricopeptide (TPR) repeat protein
MSAYEELGNVCQRMGDLPRAAQAYQAARRLGTATTDQSRLLLKQARVRQLEGSFVQARRWLTRAARLLELSGDTTIDAERARLAVARASIAKDQNRPQEIARWCQLALEEAERVGDKPTEAHAAFLLDHAYVRLGRPDLADYSRRALAVYTEIGDLWGQGSVLNNLGGHAYWRGQWDEAVDLYNRSRAVFERIGDTGSEAAGLVNVGEIRSDQGRIDEAAELFRRSLDIRQRMGDRASIAYVTSNMGRLATRSEMFGEAEQLLSNAKEIAQALGLHADVLETDLRMVECLCHRGAVDDAIALAERVAPQVPAHSLQAAMLERLVGYALLQLGRFGAARARLEVSLLEARAAEVPYEEGLTLRALAYLDSAVGVDPLAHLQAAEAILTRLGVAAVDEPVHVAMTSPMPDIPEQSVVGSTDPVAS